MGVLEKYVGSVVNQQLSVAYFMIKQYEPDLTLERFCEIYADTLKNHRMEIKKVIDELNETQKKKRKQR